MSGVTAPVDATRFREAMARFPSGVAIVATVDDQGRPHGFTASSLCSVSSTPPLVSVCLATSARCYPVFAASRRFTVNVLNAEQSQLARTFAGQSTHKFTGVAFEQSPGGTVSLDGAVAILDCDVYDRHRAGDHVILIGEVRAVAIGLAHEPALYWNRDFARICPSGPADEIQTL